MPATLEEQIEALQRMTTSEFIERFAELHGYPCRTRHRAYLLRKIACRLQANAEGDLSDRARRRASELADDAEIRAMTPKTKIRPPQPGVARTAQRSVGRERTDPRIPAARSVIVREYKGRTLRVVALPDGEGFEYEGDRYRTLTAVAKAVTGSHINGFRFFRLGGKA